MDAWQDCALAAEIRDRTSTLLEATKGES